MDVYNKLFYEYIQKDSYLSVTKIFFDWSDWIGKSGDHEQSMILRLKGEDGDFQGGIYKVLLRFNQISIDERRDEIESRIVYIYSYDCDQLCHVTAHTSIID